VIREKQKENVKFNACVYSVYT